MPLEQTEMRVPDADAAEEGAPVAPSSWFSRPRVLTTRELLAAWLALAIVGALAFAPHIRHGGFYLDDWSNGANSLYPPGGSGLGHAVSYFSTLTLYRPVLVLYVPLTYLALGTHMAFHLVWAAVLAIVAAGMLYGVLRTVAVPPFHACAISALTIIYPWYDSTRLWTTADQATLSIIFAAGGLWVALVGLKRRSWRVHFCAAPLYLLSLLTYEVTLPLIAAFGCLYVIRAGWRTTWTRWALDLLVVVAGGLWVGLQTNHESYGLSADLTHLKEIVTSGGTIAGRTLLPVGPQRTTVALGAIATVIIVGLVAHRVSRDGSLRRADWNLGSWLRLAFAGLVAAALGWVMFIPANPYYTPSVYGVTNRVNALAGFGLVISVYAVFGIVGGLVANGRRSLRLLPGLTVVLAVSLGAAYVTVLERHSGIWNAAYRAEAAGIGEMRMQFPTLAAGTTVFVAAYPAYQTLGVPIFSTNWDVNGMIKLQYKDPSLAAYPLIPGLSLGCRVNGVGLDGPGAGPSATTVSYGAARLLNVRTGAHARPRTERECKAVAPSYPPGPLNLSLGY